MGLPGVEVVVIAHTETEDMRENPAFEIAAELTFDRGWTGSAMAAVAGEFEPGGEVRLHGAIEHGAFGPATAIAGSASRGTGGRHGDTSPATERPQLYSHTVVASMTWAPTPP